MREEYVDSDGRLCVGSDSSDESDGEEYHDASDSDQWTEWWCGVASDSTTDEDDGRRRLDEGYYSDSSDIPERCWSSGEDSGEGSGGEETSGEKKTTRQEDVLDDGDRRSFGLQPVRWQVIRRKGQDELLLGSVHPYPSDEQEPRIKPRPVSSFCGWCRMCGHLWEDCPDEDKDVEELEEYWGRSKYPGKDGWRDKEEYYRQLQSWTDVWGEERRLLEYSSISRRRKKAVRRRREALFSELTGGTSARPIQEQPVYLWPTTWGDRRQPGGEKTRGGATRGGQLQPGYDKGLKKVSNTQWHRL